MVYAVGGTGGVGDDDFVNPDVGLGGSSGPIATNPNPLQAQHDWYIFHTRDDERVCPVCGPLDDVYVNGADTNRHPPLHTNCRCWLEYAYSDEDPPPDPGVPPEPPLLPPAPPPGPGPPGPYSAPGPASAPAPPGPYSAPGPASGPTPLGAFSKLGPF